MFARRKRTDLIVVHCSDTEGQDIGVREIDAWHRRRGFLMVGYHVVIRRDGTIEQGRDLYVCGAHARGDNHRSVGLCMVGGAKGKPNYTDEQWTALRAVLGSLRSTFPEAEIVGHRDTTSGVKKFCPSFDVKGWLKTVTL